MNYEKIIRGLKTVRDFKDKSVGEEVLKAMVDYASSLTLPTASKVNVKTVYRGTDVEESLKGKVGYFGNLIAAPHYILAYGEDSSDFRVNAGYFMEALRFKAEEAELGTCWLEANNDKALKIALGVEEDEFIAGILAVGIPYEGYFRQDIEKKSDRNSASEIVYSSSWGNEVMWDDLYQLGVGEAFSLVRLAPSAGNQQPWKFVMEGSEIYLFMFNRGKELTDLETGIILLYLEKAFMNLHIRRLEKSQEELEKAISTMKIPADYACRAVYTL